MNRDLVFFVAGLSFGIAAGFFVFRAVSQPTSSKTIASEAAVTEQSEIGLDSERPVVELDDAEARELEEQAEANPGDAEVRVRLAALYMDAGRYSEALPWLLSATKLAPRDLSARNSLALTYLNMGRLDDAVTTFEETLRLEPTHPASLLGLGRVKLYLQKDIDGGLRMWERLMEVAPSSVEAQSVRDELEALKSAHSGA